MPVRPTTRAQVAAYNFLRRRARHAVSERDVRMLHDPNRIRSRAFWAGLGIGVLIIAAAAVMSFLRPAGDVTRESIMIGSDSGAMYVRIDERVHPVLNLASARLLVGAPGKPTRVRDEDLAATPRGPLVGIPGAPSVLPEPLSEAEANAMTWTVCDESRASAGATHPLEQTTVWAHPGSGYDDRDGGRHADHDGAPVDDVVLGEYSGRTWLIRDGTRSRIDHIGRGLLETLGLGGAIPRRLSPALLNTLSEVTPLRPPEVPGSGETVDYGLEGVRVGQVVQSDTADGTATYVAMSDGIQRAGPAVADLVLATQTVGDTVRLPPDRLTGVPRSTQLDVSAYPPTGPHLAEPSTYPVVCAEWGAHRSTAGGAGPALHFRTSVPTAGEAPVRLSGNDGPGPRVDRVSMPGGGLLVVGVSGAPDPGPAAPLTTLVSDTGVRFDIPDRETAEVLGLGGDPVPVPSGLLDRLPMGPPLSGAAASVVHDGLEPDAGLEPEVAPEGG